MPGFIALARTVGVGAVELRDDIEGREFADGMPAAELKARFADAGLERASANALQRFNDWTPAQAEKARRLIGYAAELGAPGVVLCPAHQPDDNRHALAHDRLCKGLAALKPIFASAGVIGYVEPPLPPRDAPFVHEPRGSGHCRTGSHRRE